MLQSFTCQHMISPHMVYDGWGNYKQEDREDIVK